MRVASNLFTCETSRSQVKVSQVDMCTATLLLKLGLQLKDLSIMIGVFPGNDFTRKTKEPPSHVKQRSRHGIYLLRLRANFSKDPISSSRSQLLLLVDLRLLLLLLGERLLEPDLLLVLFLDLLEVE